MLWHVRQNGGSGMPKCRVQSIVTRVLPSLRIAENLRARSGWVNEWASGGWNLCRTYLLIAWIRAFRSELAPGHGTRLLHASKTELCEKVEAIYIHPSEKQCHTKDHQVQPRLSKGVHHGIEILQSFREYDVLDLFVKRRKVTKSLEYENDGIDEMRILPLSCRVAANDGGLLALGMSFKSVRILLLSETGTLVSIEGVACGWRILGFQKGFPGWQLVQNNL